MGGSIVVGVDAIPFPSSAVRHGLKLGGGDGGAAAAPVAHCCSRWCLDEFVSRRRRTVFCALAQLFDPSAPGKQSRGSSGGGVGENGSDEFA